MNAKGLAKDCFFFVLKTGEGEGSVGVVLVQHSTILPARPQLETSSLRVGLCMCQLLVLEYNNVLALRSRLYRSRISNFSTTIYTVGQCGTRV